MRVEYLEYLLAVVQCGSMNKAAKKLYCTQPAITNAIKSIEDEVGYRIIERSINGTVPTKLGQLIIDDAQTIIDYVNRWKKRGESNNPFSETIQVSYIGSISRANLMDVILRLEKTNPELNISLEYRMITNYRLFKRGIHDDGRQLYRIGLFLEVPSKLDEGCRFAEEHNMEVRKLADSQYGIFARSDSEIMKKERLYLSDIRNANFVMYGKFEDFPYRQTLEELNIYYGQQLGDDENVMLSIATGNCLAIRPVSIAKNNYFIETGIISFRTLEDAPMGINHYVMCPNDKNISFGEKTFIDTLQKYYHL